MKKLNVHIVFSLISLGLLMLGLNMIPLFDWDELNFAESAREMNVTKNYLYVQMGFEPFWEKPPLFMWLQALSERLFGAHVWAYKLPNVLAGVAAVNLVYHIGDNMGKRMLGSFWALATLLSFGPYLYWKSGIIDPVFNLFIVAAIYQWYKITQASLKNERAHTYYLMVGVYLGLAFLTKGPVAILITGLVVVVVTAIRSKWHEVFNIKLLLSVFGLLAVLALWVLPLLNSNGAQFLQEFIDYQIVLFKGQIERHNQPWFYHIVVLFFVAFPSSILALPHLFRNQILDRNTDIWNLFMRALFWSVLIVFSITTTKIIHYSSLCWWSLTYFGAYQVYLVYTNRWHLPKWLLIPLFVSFLGLALGLWGIPLLFNLNPTPEWLEAKLDLFSKGILSAHTTWEWWVLIPAALFTVWMLLWFFHQLMGRKSNAGILYIISGVTAVLASTLLIPRVADTLQGPVTNLIQNETKKGVFLEAWYYKTYALYFHGKFQPDDFKNLNPELPVKEDEPYPQQTARRSHAMNPDNKELIKVITKVQFVPDHSFAEKFEIDTTVGGYRLWKRR